MDKSNWDSFDCNNKVELDSSGFQAEMDINEIADDMFRINDDKLIGMVGDEFLTQFGLEEAFNNELFSADTSYSSTFDGSISEENKDEVKVFDGNGLTPTVPDLLIDDLPTKKKLKIHKEIKTEIDNGMAPILQNPPSLNHSAIILPINTITPSSSVTQIPQIKTQVRQQKIGIIF